MARLQAIVLGAAAGGGFPQWNCRCSSCREAWNGAFGVLPRTQTGVAVSADGVAWTLLNAAPDLRAQILATPTLHPDASPRGSPIKAVVLTGAEIDQIAGLLTLREGATFALHATHETLDTLAANPIFDALDSALVGRITAEPGQPFVLAGGLSAELFAVPGKVPLYLEGASASLAAAPCENVGVELVGGGARLLFVPGAAAIDDALRARLARADVVLFDGTLFADDEMIRAGLSAKTGARMGHMPVDGPEGSLAALAEVRARRIYIHLNNSNPLLIPGSPERRKAEAAGWEIAHDGLRIEL
ncbi:MAG: pyrroloquinoline quinone biosynthesis protein PqqB [Variibacter sp.]|nr:pyrroloquinoline quinone biosynthesis protein PqqB [Variibacter sp.]